MTNDQFNTLNETIKQGLKGIAEASDNYGALSGIQEELVQTRKALWALVERGINTYEQNND